MEGAEGGFTLSCNRTIKPIDESALPDVRCQRSFCSDRARPYDIVACLIEGWSATNQDFTHVGCNSDIGPVAVERARCIRKLCDQLTKFCLPGRLR